MYYITYKVKLDFLCVHSLVFGMLQPALLCTSTVLKCTVIFGSLKLSLIVELFRI